MNLRIEIDGTPVPTIMNTISVAKQINGRASQASFTVKVKNLVDPPTDQAEVIIYNTADDSKVFRGEITQRSIDQKSGSLTWWAISCTGFETLLGDTLISHTWTGQTDREIIQSAFGLVLPEISTDSSTVAELIVAIDYTAKDQTLNQLLTNLAQLSGADYRITEDLELDYHASGSVVAPFGFSDVPNV